MTGPALDAAHVDVLASDLALAIDDFVATLESESEWFARAPAGKWTAGMHADHMARTLAAFANRMEAAAKQIAAGTLPPRPGRWPLQTLFVWMLTVGPKFPRGGKSAPFAMPDQPADVAAATASLRGPLARMLAAASGLAPEARARMWFPSPVVPRWHYTLPEALRVNALHTRHHAMLVGELRGR